MLVAGGGGSSRRPAFGVYGLFGKKDCSSGRLSIEIDITLKSYRCFP
jgi:hypothetical protein